MIKILSIVFFSVSFSFAVAGERTCDDIGLEQAYPSKDVQGVTACFVYTKISLEYPKKTSIEPDGVAIYSAPMSGKSKLIYEFPYAWTKGNIDYAFPLRVEGVRDKVLFVIHSIETPRSWDTVSDIYDVSAFRLQDGGLARDQKLSRFFGMGGDFADSQGVFTYKYPYKDKVSIDEAVRSPLFHAVYFSKAIDGVIKEKTFLYDGDSEPGLQNRKKMYLIKDDRVSVIDAMEGWCKVSYAGKAEPIIMWAQCKKINFSES